MKHSKRGYNRTERVADLVQKTLAEILLQSMVDGRFHLVTLTGATVSRDFSYATIYVSVLMDEEEKIHEVVDALNRAAKSLRYELAQKIELRVIPKLKFVYDESTARGFRISTLIDSVVKKSDDE